MLSNEINGGAGNDIIYGEGVQSIQEAGELIASYQRVSTTGSHTVDPPAQVNAFVTDVEKQQDVLNGGKGNDYIVGSRGGDIIRGGSNSDRLYGGGSSFEHRDEFDGGRGNDFIDGTGGIGASVLWSRGDGIDTIAVTYGDVPLNSVSFANFEDVLSSLPDPRGISHVKMTDLSLDGAELVLRNLVLTDHIVDDGLHRYMYVADVWILDKATGQGVNLGQSLIRTMEYPLEVSQTYLRISLLPTVEFSDGSLYLIEGGPNIDFRIDGGSSSQTSFSDLSSERALLEELQSDAITPTRLDVSSHAIDLWHINVEQWHMHQDWLM